MVETTSPIWSRSEKKQQKNNDKQKTVTQEWENFDQDWELRTENSGFPSIVEAKNKNSSFLVTENGREQFGKH